MQTLTTALNLETPKLGRNKLMQELCALCLSTLLATVQLVDPNAVCLRLTVHCTVITDTGLGWGQYLCITEHGAIVEFTQRNATHPKIRIQRLVIIVK